MNKLVSKDILKLESEIGLLLPQDVKDKYLESNGLLGPTDCNLLYKYGPNDQNDIITVNKSLKLEEWFPQSMLKVILLGDDGVGNLVGYKTDTNEAILWNPEDGEWIQETRSSVTEIWEFITELYENEE